MTHADHARGALVASCQEDNGPVGADSNYPRLQKLVYPNGREVYYKYADVVGAAMRRPAEKQDIGIVSPEPLPRKSGRPKKKDRKQYCPQIT